MLDGGMAVQQASESAHLHSNLSRARVAVLKRWRKLSLAITPEKTTAEMLITIFDNIGESCFLLHVELALRRVIIKSALTDIT